MIEEYLKLIPKGIKNFDKVLDGLKNEVKAQFHALPEDELEVIAIRRAICAECPFLSSNAVSNPVIQYKTDRLDEHCIMCGCNKQAKTASLISNCGIEEYNKKNPNNQMPLKWSAYKKPSENGKKE